MFQCKNQVEKLDYSAAFQVGHPGAFQLADKLTNFAPDGFDHCFFVNSGSEATDTALKIALGYHKARRGAGRTCLVDREHGHHGVNFGGMSVGGIPGNRKMFSGSLLPNVVHLPHAHNLEQNAFSRGQPEWGAHLADDLERIVNSQDVSSIAAVIVEPACGFAGVLVPPKGYLQSLREICDRYGILLIFDEVITAFGRLVEPFRCQRLDVIPDIITTAKGITNGVVPMGAVLVRKERYDAFMNGPDYMIEFFHGYTYFGHSLATAAGLATLDVYEEEGIFEQARSLEPLFEEAIHALKDARHVIGIRNSGLMGCVEIEPRKNAPGEQGFEVHVKALEEGVFIRNGMDNLQFCPFLNSTPDLFEKTFDTLKKYLKQLIRAFKDSKPFSLIRY